MPDRRGRGPGRAGGAGDAHPVAGLREIADELYGLPIDDFTAERNARAKALRGTDRPLSEAVAALPKPALAAWAVNVLVRARPKEIDQALRLGATLREAQENLDAAALRELTTQRRRLVSALAGQAASLTGELGHRVQGGAREDVEQTLTAALVDAGAADAVRSGLVLRALTAVGLDPVDLEGAVAPVESVAASAVPRRQAGTSARSEPKPPTTEDRRRDGASGQERAREAERAKEEERRRAEEERRRAERRAEQERVIRTAEQDVQDAEAHLDETERAIRRATRGRDAKRDDLDDLQERLAQLQRRIRAAEREADEAERELASAESDQRDAERSLEGARAALDQARRALRD